MHPPDRDVRAISERCAECEFSAGDPEYDGVAHAHSSPGDPCAHCGADAEHYCCSDPDACDGS